MPGGFTGTGAAPSAYNHQSGAGYQGAASIPQDEESFEPPPAKTHTKQPSVGTGYQSSAAAPGGYHSIGGDD